jgi:hypothetical protein
MSRHDHVADPRRRDAEESVEKYFKDYSGAGSEGQPSLRSACPFGTARHAPHLSVFALEYS